MSLLVMNLRAHGLVRRLETSSGEPKQRPARRWQVAHGSTGRSWDAGFGLHSFLLIIAQREVAISRLKQGAAQLDVLTRSPWSLGHAAGCLMAGSCGSSIGLPPGLLLWVGGQACRLF